MQKLIPYAAFILLLFLFPLHISAHHPQEIQITKNGYIPDKLEIKVGDSVMFKNLDQVQHWPASNIHPTHSIYPEFDPKKPLNPGEEWEFKFEKAGVWLFHDHLLPGLTGRIVVSGPNPKKPETGQKQETLIQKTKNLFAKYYYRIFPNQLDKKLDKENIVKASEDEQKLAFYLTYGSVKKVFEKLLAETGGGSSKDCHQPAHEIGRVAYKLYKAKAFESVNYSCHSGYIHGAMESLLSETGTNGLSGKITGLCNGFETGFSQFECLHGVGHGVMAYENYNLPNALNLCKTLENDFAKDSCYGGVFMENIVTASGLGFATDHKTKWLSNDPYFPCNQLESDKNIQTQCYLMQTSQMLKITNFDFGKVADLCSNAPSDFVTACFKSYGRDIAGYTLRDPDKIIQYCTNSDSYFDTCITGGLNVIVDFWGSNLNSQAAVLCKKIKNEKSKNNCYNSLTSRLLGVFGRDKQSIESQCLQYEEGYRNSCKSILEL